LQNKFLLFHFYLFFLQEEKDDDIIYSPDDVIFNAARYEFVESYISSTARKIE